MNKKWYQSRIKGPWQLAYIRRHQKPTVKCKPVVKVIPQPRRDEGYIYIVHCKDSANYKIGKSTQPTYRVKSHQTSCPYELELEYHISVLNMTDVEHVVHGLYESKRVRGEWYELSEDDIEQIKAVLISVRGCLTYDECKTISKQTAHSLP